MAATNGDNDCTPTDYGSVEHLPQHERNDFKSLLVEENGLDKRKTKPRRQDWLLRTLLLLFVTVTIIIGFTSWHAQNKQRTNLSSNDDDDSPYYEYIVVGGGPAGILTATKLAKHLLTTYSSKTLSKVLLLESGTDSQSSVYANLDTTRKTTTGPVLSDQHKDLRLNKFDIPLMWSGVAFSRRPQDEAFAAHHWPIKRVLLARALGGCGLCNAMIYVRSLPTDFVRWNLKGWTWDAILPHYKSLERFVDTLWSRPSFWNETSLTHKPWRGHDGPIVTVPAGPKIDSVSPLFIESAIHSGLPLAEQGFNSPDASKRVGVGYYEFNIHNGIRDSVAQAMLGKAGDSTIPVNLVVQTGATVTRVLTETHEGVARAVGVEYFTDNDSVPSHALLKDNGEAILAAGAIMTPQLLVNSGIGDGGSVVHLPGVGKNLQDHPVVTLTFMLNAQVAEAAPSMFTLASDFQNYFLSVEHLRKAESGEDMTDSHEPEKWASLLGTLGTPGFSSGAFLESPWAQHDSPDIQLTIFPRIVEPHVIRREKNETDDPYLLESKAMLVTVALLQPEGRYQVRASKPRVDAAYSTAEIKPHLASAFSESSDFSLPSVELPENKTSYLSDTDVKRLSWGMQQVRRILSFAPLHNMTGGELYPGSKIVGKDLEKHIRKNHLTNSHWVGSTKMGSEEDPLAVVDEQLRVRGVKNLRIVDAGVIPVIPNGNTHSTVCVVASRAVEMMMAEKSQH